VRMCFVSQLRFETSDLGIEFDLAETLSLVALP
jgi:hypothetical protein